MTDADTPDRLADLTKQIRTVLDWRDTGEVNDAGFALYRATLPGIAVAVISQVADEPRTKTGRRATRGEHAEYARSRMFGGFVSTPDGGQAKTLQGGSLDELKDHANKFAAEMLARKIHAYQDDNPVNS
ncbi:hypothetical protein [Nocardia sp. NPDC057030]|uniref:hypothetical protein n=1 Tax=unclassified Nocardia TaxID=2637762 RepID=UPI00363033A0